MVSHFASVRRGSEPARPVGRACACSSHPPVVQTATSPNNPLPAWWASRNGPCAFVDLQPGGTT
eukprot:6040059-Alexandrium_andersonii.AAC.1